MYVYIHNDIRVKFNLINFTFYILISLRMIKIWLILYYILIKTTSIFLKGEVTESNSL